MNIALVSYEYPPETAFGGIATYMAELAGILQERKHLVEVFCASPKGANSSFREGILIHRVETQSRRDFRHDITACFQERHNRVHFDVVECAEFFGDCLEIASLQVPIIVRLHGPRFLLHEVVSISARQGITFHIKQCIKKLILREVNYNKGYYDYKLDDDYLMAGLAARLSSPSDALKAVVVQRWQIYVEKVSVIPNPFQPGNDLLRLNENDKAKTITFIGRLEFLKGIMIFYELIPSILKRYPDVKFRFIGKIMDNHKTGLPYDKCIRKSFPQYSSRLEFTGQVHRAEISHYLEDSILCLVPSLWENFPYVCLECMSAGQAVIASNRGGIPEIIDDGRNGLLADPSIPESFVKAIDFLLENPVRRREIGIAARKTILRKYNYEVFGSRIESLYQEAILGYY